MKKKSSSQSAWSLLAGSISQARVESHRISHMINRGQKLVEGSVAKDHLYEVAGDLITGVPQRLANLDRLLDRTNYALSLMGQDFYRGRLSLDDKEMVDQAVKFSQTPFPSARRVANRYIKKVAGAKEVIARAQQALNAGNITAQEFQRVVNDPGNVDNRLASKIFPEARFKFSHNGGQIKIKVPNKGKVPFENRNLIGQSVTVKSHAFYRYVYRDFDKTKLNTILNGFANALFRGFIDNKSRERRDTDNAKLYRIAKNSRGRDSFPYHHHATDTSIVVVTAPDGTTDRFVVWLVTMHEGKARGGVRSRLASQQDVEDKILSARYYGHLSDTDAQRLIKKSDKLKNSELRNIRDENDQMYYKSKKLYYSYKSLPVLLGGFPRKTPRIIKNVVLTSHARYRMELRDISDSTMSKMVNEFQRAYAIGKEDYKKGENSGERICYETYSMGDDSVRYFNRQLNITIVIAKSSRNHNDAVILTVMIGHNYDGGSAVRQRKAYRQPASELPGASTYVNEDSKKNLTPNTSKGVNDNADSREKSGPQITENKQQALPLKSEHSEKRDKKLPISQTDGQGTARPQFNTPPDSENAEGGRPIHKEKVRTRSMPGDEYGTPHKDDGYSLTRRTMKATVSRLANIYLASLSSYMRKEIENATTASELASIYSTGESMIDFNHSEATEIMQAVEKRVRELGLSREFDRLI